MVEEKNITLVCIVEIIISLISIETSRRYCLINSRDNKTSLFFQSLVLFIFNIVNGIIGSISGRWHGNDARLAHGISASIIVVFFTVVLVQIVIDGLKQQILSAPSNNNETTEQRRERRLAYFLISFIIIQIICGLISIGSVSPALNF